VGQEQTALIGSRFFKHYGVMAAPSPSLAEPLNQHADLRGTCKGVKLLTVLLFMSFVMLFSFSDMFTVSSSIGADASMYALQVKTDASTGSVPVQELSRKSRQIVNAQSFIQPAKDFARASPQLRVWAVPRTQPVIRTVAALPDIKVERLTEEEAQTKYGISSWGSWGCPASKFDWTYSGNEMCYLLKGKVTVIPTGSWASVAPATFGAGDMVTLPDGMTCVWDVSEAVEKKYKFF